MQDSCHRRHADLAGQKRQVQTPKTQLRLIIRCLIFLLLKYVLRMEDKTLFYNLNQMKLVRKYILCTQCTQLYFSGGGGGGFTGLAVLFSSDPFPLGYGTFFFKCN